MNSGLSNSKILEQRAMLRAGDWESSAGTGMRVLAAHAVARPHSQRMLLAAGICPLPRPPANWTSCEMDSYPEPTSALPPPSMPHPGLGDTLCLRSQCQPDCHGGADSPGASRGQPSAGSALDALRGMWPNLLPASECRPPTRGVHKAPWPRGGSARLTKEVLS